MGEAKRRREYEARNRIPDDVRTDLANIVQVIDIPQAHDGKSGTCYYRAIAGRRLLKMVGVTANIAAGALVYRAGPDAVRDSILFGLPDYVGAYIPGVGLMGHVWLETRTDFIDFSCVDWKSGYLSEELEVKFPNVDYDELEGLHWEVDPPAYLWVPKRTVLPAKNQDMPDLGKAWYMGWQGPPPPFDQYQLDWQEVDPYFERCCREYQLSERIGLNG